MEVLARRWAIAAGDFMKKKDMGSQQHSDNRAECCNFNALDR